MPAKSEDELLEIFASILEAPPEKQTLVADLLPIAKQKKDASPDLWTKRVAAAYGDMIRELNEKSAAAAAQAAVTKAAQEDPTKRTCSVCDGRLGSDAFSKNQWKKGATRACKTCVASKD